MMSTTNSAHTTCLHSDRAVYDDASAGSGAGMEDGRAYGGTSWAEALAVVVFDTDVGQRVDMLHPPDAVCMRMRRHLSRMPS